MRVLLLLAGLLTLCGQERAAAQASAALLAQTFTTEPGTPYAIARDSLLRRAARVRARTEARLVRFSTAFAAVGGTRRKTVSFGRLKSAGNLGPGARYARVKVQISKHKTSGAEVEKIYCYGIGKRLLLAEYYEQHRLVRLELHEYPVREGGEYGPVLRKTQWVSGDYLRVTTYAPENRGNAQQDYYSSPLAPR